MKYIAKFEDLTEVKIGDIQAKFFEITISRDNGKTYVNGWVNCKQVGLTDTYNGTSDPQNDEEFPFDALQVTEEDYAQAVDWSDNIMAIHDMPFDIQDFSVQINNELKEFFSDKYIADAKAEADKF